MCMWFGYNPQINFCHFFCILNSAIFQVQILPKCIDIGYLLLQFYAKFFLKLSRCFCHVLKMCMWFGYNPQIHFCHIYRILNLIIVNFSGSKTTHVCIYSRYPVCPSTPMDFCASVWNFTDVFHMVWRCACALDINPQINFCYFFRIFSLVIFFFIFVCNKKVAEYYVIPFECLSIRHH